MIMRDISTPTLGFSHAFLMSTHGSCNRRRPLRLRADVNTSTGSVSRPFTDNNMVISVTSTTGKVRDMNTEEVM
jgi:hypothetical protein